MLYNKKLLIKWLKLTLSTIMLLSANFQSFSQTAPQKKSTNQSQVIQTNPIELREIINKLRNSPKEVNKLCNNEQKMSNCLINQILSDKRRVKIDLTKEAKLALIEAKASDKLITTICEKNLDSIGEKIAEYREKCDLAQGPCSDIAIATNNTFLERLSDCYSVKDAAAAHFETGFLRYKEGKYTESIQELEKAIEKNYLGQHIYELIGRNHLLNNNYDEALKAFNIALRYNGDMEMALFNRAAIYIFKNQYDLAIQDYTKVINSDPEFAEAYANRGSAYLNKSENDLAIKDLDKAIGLLPEFTMAYLNRGTAFLNRGKYDLALKDINKAIELEASALAYLNRGNVFHKKGEYDSALLDYNKAVELSPHLSIAYSNRSVILGMQNNYDSAVKSINEAIEINPDFAIYYFIRAGLFAHQNLKQPAVEDYSRAINLYTEKKDVRLSLEYFVKYSYNENIKLSDIYLTRGHIFHDIKKYDSAIRDYQKVLEINPGFIEAYSHIADTYEEMDENDSAIRMYSKIIELKPDDAQGYFERAIFYQKKKNYQQALEDITKAIDISPNERYLYMVRASIYEECNQLEKAEADLNKEKELRGKPRL